MVSYLQVYTKIFVDANLFTKYFVERYKFPLAILNEGFIFGVVHETNPRQQAKKEK